MTHFAKPFYKQSRQCWYAELGRRQYSLGPNPPGRPKPRKRNGVWQAPPEMLGEGKVKSESDVDEVEFEAKGKSDLCVVHMKIAPQGHTT
jgi:hypothetical protein